MSRYRIEAEYRLPREIYMSTLWYIRNYRRWCEQREEVLEGTPKPDGQPRPTLPGDPTARAAERLAMLSGKIRPIEQALEHVPEEYRRGVLRAIIERERYPDYADEKTWKRWRQRFVYFVAVETGMHYKGGGR